MRYITFAATILIAFAVVDSARQMRPYPSWMPLAPLPVEIPVTPADNLQTKYNAAVCGDSLVLQAGGTWDTANVNTAFSFTKACTSGSPLTIKSSASASLPAGRVSPSNAGNMARIRAKGQEGLISLGAGAYHTFDGIEMTNVGSDTATEIVGAMIDGTNTTLNHVTIKRCYIHPKETGTDYTRSVREFMFFNGSFLTFKWNYASGFLGRMAAGDTGVNTNRIITCITCNNLTVDDNFLQAWYGALFTGGGQEDPQHTGTVTGGTTSSGTFSNTTGLAAGRYVRFTLTGQMTITGSSTICDDHTGGTQTTCRTATQDSGTTLNSGDVDHGIWLTPTGGGAIFRARVSVVSGGVITMYPNSTGATPNGTYNYELFEVANVSSVAGSTVNYTPVGTNALNHNPDSGGAVAWRADQVVHDLVITKNTFDIDFDSAMFEHNLSGNSPKGWWEFKSGDGILIEGNTFTGYVSTMGLGQYSNEGTTPWTKIKNVTIRSNFIRSEPSELFPGDDYLAARSFFTGHLTDPYNTTEPGGTVLITNNLILGEACFIAGAAFANFTITHNTVINNEQPRHSNSIFPSQNFGTDTLNTGWVYKDNIVFNNDSGFNCQISPGTIGTCWPGMTILNNVMVNNYNWSSGLLTSVYGSGILSPIVTNESGVGFVGATSTCFASPTNCALGPSSPFENRATDGADPGVNIIALLAALSSAPAPTPSPTPPQPGSICRWNTTPPCRVP